VADPRWQPSPRTRSLVIVGLGLLLIFNPLYLAPLGIGSPQYEYRAVEVVPTESGLQFASEPPDITRVDGIDCYRELDPVLDCWFQQSFTDGQNYTVTAPDARQDTWKSYTYLNGTFYARSFRVSSSGGNDTQVSWQFRPIDPETMLANVGINVSVRDVYRRAVERGQIQTTEPLHYEEFTGGNTDEATGRFIKTDNGYYMLGFEEYHPGVENRWLYSAIGVVIGVLCLWHGFGKR
jgi:hypothetical protein